MADQPINIHFIGSDDGGVTITSPYSSVIVDGAIQDAAGHDEHHIAGGQIEQGSATGVVGGHNIILTASSGIGAGNALSVNLTNPNNRPSA